MTIVSGLSQGAHIKLDGTPLPAALYDQLIDARVERSISVASHFSLRFFDPDFALIDSGRFAIGKAIDIDFSDISGTYQPVFTGEIVSLAVEQAGSERHELIVSGYDKSHRLGHASKVRAFQNQTYTNVIQTIARENGFRADVTLEGPVTYEYLLQTTTDFAFLTDIALRTGSEWSVEGTTLRFRPRPEAAPASELEFGEDLRRFRARYTAAEHTGGVTVRGWNSTTNQAVVGQETVSFTSAPAGNAPPLHGKSRREARIFGGNLVTGTVGVLSVNEATKVAKGLGGRIAGAEFTAKGEAIGRPDLKAGSAVTVKGVGTSMSGTYYLTSVEHVLGEGRPLLTRFTVGGLEPSSLVDLLGSPEGSARPWGELGITVGIVTNNNSSQYPGQVKVKFPALSDDVESAWARVASLGAGAGRGLLFMPEVNDEVLVAFEHGDLRRPYVLGGLWDASDALPIATYVEQNKVTTNMIKTRAGHTLTFKDGTAPADRHFSVILADGTTKLFVGEDKVEVWASDNKPLQLKSGQATVTLKNQGDIEIKGLNITIAATQALKLSGLNVEIKANATLKAEASAMLELKSTGPAKLESSALCEVKGTLLKLN